MTSAVEPHGASLGFVHRAFIEAGKTGTQFDNFGGEDRFWLGPEGGQFGLYFPPGAPFEIASWQVPHELQEGEWAITQRDAVHVTFTRRMHLTSWSGTALDVTVERTVRVLGAGDVGARFGVAPSDGTRWVAFESDNRITNAGSAAWTRDVGLPSIWILGMYSLHGFRRARRRAIRSRGPRADRERRVLRQGRRPIASSSTATRDGSRSGPMATTGARSASARRARETSRVALHSASARLLTLVHYKNPTSAPDGYVNSLWAKQADPYGGDVVNAYNDGPTEPGKPSLGGFYELETSSPAAALAPGQSIEHVHTTLHVTGDTAALDALARRVLGMPLARLSE